MSDEYLEMTFEGDYLGCAILDNDVATFQRLLPQIMPHEQYYFACAELGRLEMLQQLPRNYIVLDPDCKNLLHYACEFGHEDVVLFLSQAEPDLIYSLNNFGYSPFHIACEKGYFRIVRYLLDNCRTVLESPPSSTVGSFLNALLLHTIDQFGYEIIKDVVESNPTLLHIARYQQLPLFQIFCNHQIFHQRNQLITLFLKYDCPVLSKDANGRNILHYVIQEENALMTVEFINRGVDINEQDFEGNTPLHTYYLTVVNKPYVERDFGFITVPIQWQLVNKSGQSVEFLKNLAVSVNYTPGRKRLQYDDSESCKQFKNNKY